MMNSMESKQNAQTYPEIKVSDITFEEKQCEEGDVESGEAYVEEHRVRKLATDNTRRYSLEPYQKEHLGDSREYWRDMVLGVNDGLVSTFLLVAGVYGSGLDSHSILLTAVSGMIAGAISMAGGEYVATKTQEEVIRAECNLEEKAIKQHKQYELSHLNDLLTNIGIPEADSPDDEAFNVRLAMLRYCEKNDDAHHKINVALALGSVEASERNPFIAGLVAFFLFTFGSLTSVLPFVFIKDRYTALIVSFVITMVVILLVGAVKTWATKASWLVSAFENFIITTGGGAIAYGIGVAFENLLSHSVSVSS